MVQPLRLAIDITADAAGVQRGVGAARAALDGLGSGARASAGALETLDQAQTRAAASSHEAATASAASAQALGAQEQAAAKAVRALSQLAAHQREAAQAGVGANRNTLTGIAALNGRLGVRDDFGGAARALDVAEYGRALDDLRTKYSPLYAAQRQYLSTLAEIRRAQKVGALDAKESAEAIERLKATFAARVVELKGGGGTPLGKGTGGTGSAWSQLRPDQRFGVTRQIPDVLQSLALGMPLSSVVMQQGPQMVDGLGGVSNALKLLGSLINPVTVGLAALTGAVLAGGAAWLSYTMATKQAATVASSYGRATGTSAGDIERTAYRSAPASGLSVREAREVATELTRTAKIGAQEFEGLIGVAKDFAATMRTDVSTGAQELGKIFAAPAAGADTLQQMGLLDGATARLTKSYAEAGDQERARAALLAGLRTRLASADEATTQLARGWAKLGRAVSDGWEAVGRNLAGDEAPLEARIAGITQVIARQRALTLGWGDSSQLEAQRARWQRELAEEQAASAARARTAQATQAGTVAIESARTSPANADLEARIALTAQLRQLQAGQGAPGLTAREQEEVTRAIEATRHALDGLVGAQARQVEIERLDLAIQYERDPIQRANLTAFRDLLALQSEQVGKVEETRQVERARQRSLEQSAAAAKEVARATIQSAQDQMSLARVELAMIGATNTERARALALEQARQTSAANALDPQATQAVARAMTEAADAASRLAGAQAGQSMILAGAQQIAQLGEELRLIGATNAERARALALLQAEQQIKAQDITDPAQQARIRSDAVRAADLTSRLAAAQAARQSYETNRDTLEQLALEGQLIGATNGERTRAIALLQTEQMIRRSGIDAGSAEARQLREQAAAIAEQSDALARRHDAWGDYAAAGSSAIDKLGDALAEGRQSWADWGSMARDVLKDVSKSLIQLGFSNPLKNALFGTNLGTLADLGKGGGGGLIGQITQALGGGTASSAPVTAGAGVLSALGSATGVVNMTAGVVNVMGALGPGLGAAVGAGGMGGGTGPSQTYAALGALPALAADRAKFAAELADPLVRQKIYGMVAAETGGQSQFAQQSLMESIFNRASSRGQSLAYAATDRGYYAASSFPAANRAMADPGALEARYGGMLDQVRGGSNVSNFATGNWSGAWGRGTNGGYVSAYHGGEQSVVEGPDMAWARQMQQSAGAFDTSLTTTSQSVTQFGDGLTNATQQATSALTNTSSSLTAGGGAARDMTTGLTGATNATGDFASGLGSAIQQLMSSIGDALSGVGKGIASLFGGGGAAFATGGIMTSRGPLPLRAYASGGIASSPQLALYGEGSRPEAYVPLPDGRSIPVTMRGSGGRASSAPVNVTVINAVGAQVRTETNAGTDGGQQVTVYLDAVTDHVLSDLRRDGPISRGISSRYGVSAARGLA